MQVGKPIPYACRAIDLVPNRSIRPFVDGVPFPDFPERVFFHPRVEFFGLGSFKLRRSLISLHNHDIVRLEAIDECAGLRADQHLRMLAYGTK